MRVPSVGLTSEERQIIAEGYRLAERLLADYQDKPTTLQIVGNWLGQLRLAILNRA